MSRPPLRAFQKSALDAVLRAEGAHVLVIAATGSGKSRIYEDLAQVHGLRVLLITPLSALARQQKERLLSLGVSESGFRIFNPESLRNPRVLAELEAWRPDILVVDECHCLWEWGPSFRPAFLEIPPLIERFRIERSLWMTATLPPEARQDLRARVGRNWVELGTFELPPNLFLSAERVGWPDRNREAIRWIQSRPGSGIVFMPTREASERSAKLLQAMGISAAPYHAGLSSEEKEVTVRALMTQKFRVLAATSAFGMGMDIPQLRWVLLWQAPPSLLSLAQSLGRAGRDARYPAWGHILWDPLDFSSLRGIVRDETKLTPVDSLLRTLRCRRATLREYFDPRQRLETFCENLCDVCAQRSSNVFFIRQTSVPKKFTDALA